MEPLAGIVFFVGTLAGLVPPPFQAPPNWNYTGLHAGTPMVHGIKNFHFYHLKPFEVFGDPDPGSPAAKAGFKRGDVILTFNGKRYPNSGLYQLALFRCKPGDVLAYVVEREGKPLTLKLTLGERDPNFDRPRPKGKDKD